MLLMLIRLAFIGTIMGAAVTGSPTFAAVSLPLLAILFFTDGLKAAIGYGVIAIIIVALFTGRRIA